MSSIIPEKRPQLLPAEALKMLAPFSLSNYPVKLLGIRGYYKQSMGNPVTNDTGIYDDAIFIVAPHFYERYNANTDPSVLKPRVATLKAGNAYLYKIGLHNMKAPYEALRQHGRVTVIRNGKEETDTAKAPFYIDIHRGGYHTTSSLGCQTIYPDQWRAFLAMVKDQLQINKQDIIPYVLVEA